MSPLDMAANIALLDDVAAGGVSLGIARGAWLAEHGLSEPAKPLQAIRECVEVVRRLLGGEGGYYGQVYQLAEHVKAPYPLPQRPIPILIGSWGQKLCALAGEVADEVKVGGSTNPDLVPMIQGYIAGGEKVAGRKQGSVGVVMGAVTVADEDRLAARRHAKQAVALYLPVVAALDPTVQVDPDLIQRIEHFVQSGDSEAAGQLISDDLLERFAFAGNAADLIAQAERLFAAGASRVEFGTPHGLIPKEGVRILGEQVLPALGKG
jgi:5,10-methylenetetrahydromethanopterin reductase